MRKNIRKSIAATLAFALSALSLLFAGSLPAHAQEQRQGEPRAASPQTHGVGGHDAQDESALPHERGHVGLLARLNLSPEQLAQIRTIRRETEPEGRLLTRRLREARRALNEAIYSDNADDALVGARLDEFTSAQAALARLHALTELKVRRVLTPEQLGILRDLRRQTQSIQRERRRRGTNDQPFNQGDAPDDRRLVRQPDTASDNRNAPAAPSFNPRERRGRLLRRRPRL